MAGDMATKIAVGAGLAVATALAYRTMGSMVSGPKGEQVPAFLRDPKFASVAAIIAEKLDEITNDSLIKIARQLDFWVREGSEGKELESLAGQLVHIATWRTRGPECKVPKLRFGRTELQMPTITCGTMRFQYTWMPDNMGFLGKNKDIALKHPSQDNIVDVVRNCIKAGINHFETSRFYGTSELQLSAALKKLMDDGEIKRSDFILQTKLPVRESGQEFEDRFNESWAHFECLGHIDLLSFWVVSKPESVKWSLDDAPDGNMARALAWKKAGKIKNIGFSSHGSSETIMEMIESNKFDYCNLHTHLFGSYHAEGTKGTYAGHGCDPCVKRAHELDMGVFCISPVDKGGMLYMPSKTVARTLGPETSPITIAALYQWETLGAHTVSVGFARPEDLDEIVYAAEVFGRSDKGPMKKELAKGLANLDALAKKRLGAEWHERGMLNLPSFFDESTQGVAMGHILWCNNLLKAYDMYDMAKERYKGMEIFDKWNKKKSYEENMKAMEGGNPGRAFDPDVDLTKALKAHYDPETALQKMKETHELLNKKSKFSDEERKERGWEAAYDLRQWHEYPDTNRITVPGIMLQCISRGRMGIGGGPTTASKHLGESIRSVIASQ